MSVAIEKCSEAGDCFVAMVSDVALAGELLSCCLSNCLDTEAAIHTSNSSSRPLLTCCLLRWCRGRCCLADWFARRQHSCFARPISCTSMYRWPWGGHCISAVPKALACAAVNQLHDCFCLINALQASFGTLVMLVKHIECGGVHGYSHPAIARVRSRKQC